MTASERSYQAFLDRRGAEGLRRSLTEVAAPGAREIRIGGRVVADGDARHVLSGGRERRLLLVDPDAGPSAREAGAGMLTAPLPATVTAVHVETGRKVSRGEALIVLEADDDVPIGA